MGNGQQGMEDAAGTHHAQNVCYSSDDEDEMGSEWIVELAASGLTGVGCPGFCQSGARSNRGAKRCQKVPKGAVRPGPLLRWGDAFSKNGQETVNFW
jgi:hypothetical protein